MMATAEVGSRSAASALFHAIERHQGREKRTVAHHAGDKAMAEAIDLSLFK
jgi:hypothetical protein